MLDGLSLKENKFPGLILFQNSIINIGAFKAQSE